MLDTTIPKEHIDADAQKVIRHLIRGGYQAYLVGGCVRDLLLDHKPKDFDVATSATPSEIRELFRNCRIIGRRFRLAHVVFGSKIIETATFRANPREDVEGDEGDGGGGELYIHRDNVFGNAEEDARRRDFTINGLFYDLVEEHVIDYVDGLADLRARHVRTIGDPNVRFREDPVRILRAVKFAARLGFDIEDQTYRAMITHAAEINKSAAPRVLEEIYRLLRGSAAVESMVLLGETGLLAEMLPEVAELLSEAPAALDPYLRLLDEYVRAGETPSNAALLTLLCAPRLGPLLDEPAVERLRDPVGFIEGVLAPLCVRLKAARRDAERARQLLLLQRRFAQVRKRGGKLPAALLSRELGHEALGLHALLYRAHRETNGVPPARIASEMDVWPFPKHRLGAPAQPAAELPADGAAAQPRRRRRLRSDSDADAKKAAPTPRPGEDEDAVSADEQAAIDAYTTALADPRYED